MIGHVHAQAPDVHVMRHGRPSSYLLGCMVRLTVDAHPGARHERIELLDDDTLEVWVRARPVDGRANAAIERAVASALGMRLQHVQVVSGHRSRRKIVEVELADFEVLRTKLVAHGVRSS
jgi:uncharacterized protein